MADLSFAVCYRLTWPDGFGARGWKFASALDDPQIIASTPTTGARIPTSVFVHDLLDHMLCGLPPSGHRAEAVALMQLAARTGADPRPDFAQMVDEDLLQGQVNGEPMRRFLPRDWLDVLPDADQIPDLHLVAALMRALGRAVVRERLIDWFFTLGQAGASQAVAHYRAQGLDPDRRGPLGLALQRLFEKADGWVVDQGGAMAEGQVDLSSDRVGLSLSFPDTWHAESTY